jgi:hypothetical protein
MSCAADDVSLFCKDGCLHEFGYIGTYEETHPDLSVYRCRRCGLLSGMIYGEDVPSIWHDAASIEELEDSFAVEYVMES